MRALALLAAFAVMPTIHALPQHDLAARQGEDELSNARHVFHHMDRNQRTAHHDRTHGESAERSRPQVVKRFPDELHQAEGWKMAEESIVGRQYIQDPDYSQSRGGTGGDSNPMASPASNTMTA